MTRLLKLRIRTVCLPAWVSISHASLSCYWCANVVATIASPATCVLAGVSRRVFRVQVVIRRTRRCVGVTSVPGAGRSVRVVAKEEVVFGVVGILGARVPKHISRRELIQREQHVVYHRVPNSSAVSKREVVRVTQRIPLCIVWSRSIYGSCVVEEGRLLGLIGVEGSHRSGGFVCSRGPCGRGGPRAVAREVVHRLLYLGCICLGLAALHASVLEHSPGTAMRHQKGHGQAIEVLLAGRIDRRG